MRSVNVNSHQVWDEDSSAEQLQVSSALQPEPHAADFTAPRSCADFSFPNSPFMLDSKRSGSGLQGVTPHMAP